MAAIVRMRRRRDEDQMDEVVIHLKRARKSGNGEDEERLAKKFKYAATVDSKDKSVVDPVSNAIREYKLNKLRNVVNEEKDVLFQNRCTKLINYKIIDKKKSKDFNSLGVTNEADTEARYLFLDVEKNIQNEVDAPVKEVSDDEYMYDLYYMNEYNFDYSYFDCIQDVQAFRQSNDFWIENDEEYEDGGDDDDENAEDYYTNQYPDPDDLIRMNINDDEDEEEDEDKEDEDKEDGSEDDDDDDNHDDDDYIEQCYKPV